MKRKKTDYEKLQELRASIRHAIRRIYSLEVTETKASTYVCKRNNDNTDSPINWTGEELSRISLSEGKVIKLNDLAPIIERLQEYV